MDSIVQVITVFIKILDMHINISFLNGIISVVFVRNVTLQEMVSFHCVTYFF